MIKYCDYVNCTHRLCKAHVYNKNDNFDYEIVQVFDNCHRLADWLGTTYDSVVSGVGRVLSGYCSCLINKGNKYKVYAYEVKK